MLNLYVILNDCLGCFFTYKKTFDISTALEFVRIIIIIIIHFYDKLLVFG